ncbi:uncharacterized protein BT62DRAFT_371012 [Guyanagaster necrorhizus]|uniref:Uncharacterized protein n=1 Tax=Guyanagaster necrorhizus TaxID=856835 RepID=A0A9P7VLH2_9AGAR|nr:uncharacterized protein BT62DRAFT_371012 [Guyanagaster necrorhizus MCA 3950]KAG7442720.1 hypothetical protein BT62DRAFT_371012 [Guyanagaster necrorhizus MCA 3950]
MKRRVRNDDESKKETSTCNIQNRSKIDRRNKKEKSKFKSRRNARRKKSKTSVRKPINQVQEI